VHIAAHQFFFGAAMRRRQRAAIVWVVTHHAHTFRSDQRGDSRRKTFAAQGARWKSDRTPGLVAAQDQGGRLIRPLEFRRQLEKQLQPIAPHLNASLSALAGKIERFE
jgi:hypothetical protein